MRIEISIDDKDMMPEAAHSLVKGALDLSNPYSCMKRHIKASAGGFVLGEHRVDILGQLVLISIGKAAEAMALAFIESSQAHIDRGIIIGKHITLDESRCLNGVSIRQGDHPVPGEKSILSTMELATMIQGLNHNDTVVCLISGGGSALATLPQPGITLQDIQETTRLLLKCGVKINEINCIRKHLDRIKGGGLLRMVQPAQLVSIILSDVVGSPLDVIASGPTTPDPSTFKQAKSILMKYGLVDQVPSQVNMVIERGIAGEIPETLKQEQLHGYRYKSVIIGSNHQTAMGLIEIAEKLGYRSLMMTTRLEGEAREAGLFLASIAKEVWSSGNPASRPCCLVFGGETTVTVRGDGVGGRNLEVALGAVESLSGLHGIHLITLATDGEDGTTDVAGAIVSSNTFGRGLARTGHPSEFLRLNNSYKYFENVGGLIKTGHTGTNVNDLAIILCEKSA